MSVTTELAVDLIGRPSVTPRDEGCQEYIAERLAEVGFIIEPLHYGEVDNLWAWHGDGKPLFVFAGHTDVVPPGPLDAWHSDPFVPEIRDGYLYGRGAADMKGSVAAMVSAGARYVLRYPEHRGTIAFLITSDEEGSAVDGTARVIRHLHDRGVTIDWCLVGEPSCHKELGDVIKYGRRGSLNGKLTIKGVQGHAAYPDRVINPVHRFAPVMAALCSTTWDQGNLSFPPTTFQISNINAGTGADNVTPANLEVKFNFRYSSEVTHKELTDRVEALLDQFETNYELDWRLSGEPFLTTPGPLIEATQSSIRELTGIEAKLNTSGGTSDGRFIAPTGAEVVELGPVNDTIHKVNECVRLKDLDTLSTIYERILARLLA
ncbi:MAG: succinyl-diaminopimelate desuccinylase [Gammaproteobacteria bacterium]|nr:succinyl-diaminopimelate desuccinylase [Gammaproteobacteria bacterium]